MVVSFIQSILVHRNLKHVKWGCLLRNYEKCPTVATKRRKYYSKLSYRNNPGSEPLRSLTLGQLLEQTCEKHGDVPAIISRHQNQTLTFQQVLDLADKQAAGMRALGLNLGDRVGIWAPNLVEWYVTYMACARGGYILVNINTAYRSSEVEYCVKKVGIKSMICAEKFKRQNYFEILNEISPEISRCEPGKLRCNEMPTLQSVIVASDEKLSGAFNYEEIMDLATPALIENIKSNQDLIDPDDPCQIQFTSGTTSQPKAAVHSHFQLVNNSYFTGKRNELGRKCHKICVQVPFFHAFGTDIAIGAALNHGTTLVLPSSGYDPDKSLDAIRDEKCTIIYGTPTMYVDLIKRQKERKDIINPEIAVAGGASCSPHLFREMKDVLKVKKVKSVYGLTETTAVVFQSHFDDDDYQSTATVGSLQEHLEAKVVDSKGKMVPWGTPGELCIRGYVTTMGYWQDEEKTRELIGPDQWLKTGDQFVLDENGYGRVVGRIKELIIRGGENIYPKEIEDFLNAHPYIIETQVIGLPHERLGEEVCACVRIQEDISLTIEDIHGYCKGKIAYYKIPSVLKVVKDFPKTTSGKIQKHKIIKNLNLEPEK